MHAEQHYLFRHAFLREAAYQLHMPSARAELHAIAFNVIETSAGAELPLLAEELADHAAAGAMVAPGLADQEARMLRLAADHARGAFENARALDLLVRLAAHPRAADAPRARLDAALVCLLMGRADECERLVPDTPDNPPLQVECLLAVCEARAHRGDFGAAQNAAEQAIALAQSAGLSPLAQEARISMVRTLQRTGQVGRTLQLCDDLLASSAGKFKSMVMALKAWALMQQSENSDALQLYELAEQQHVATGDARGALSCRGNIGSVLRRLGRIEEGLQCYQQVLVEARRMGDQRAVLTGLGNLGNAHRQLGRFDQALDYLLQAEAMARELGDPHAAAMNVSARGIVLYEVGRHEEAHALLCQAEAEHRRLGSMQGVAATVVNRATVAAHLGMHAEAVQAARESIALLAELQMRNPFVELSLREVLVRALTGLEQHEEARETARNALRWLQDQDLPDSADTLQWKEALRTAAQ